MLLLISVYILLTFHQLNTFFVTFIFLYFFYIITKAKLLFFVVIVVVFMIVKTVCFKHNFYTALILSVDDPELCSL